MIVIRGPDGTGPHSLRGKDQPPAGMPMANMKVFKDVQHPVYGRGYALWEFRGFYEVHYPFGDHVRVIAYVGKDDGVGWLTLFLPLNVDKQEWQKLWQEVRQVDWLKKAAAAKAAAGPKETEVTADGFAEKFPAVFSFMAATTYDGKPRELCKVQVFADAGVWKAALHDPNGEASLFVTLASPLDAFKTLEKSLQAETVDWRYWPRKGAKKGR